MPVFFIGIKVCIPWRANDLMWCIHAVCYCTILTADMHWDNGGRSSSRNRRVAGLISSPSASAVSSSTHWWWSEGMAVCHTMAAIHIATSV